MRSVALALDSTLLDLRPLAPAARARRPLAQTLAEPVLRLRRVSVAGALLAVTLFMGHYASVATISGTSMEPSLHRGAIAVGVRRDSFLDWPLLPGDVVGFYGPGPSGGAPRLMVKRIVEVRADGAIWVRGDNPQAFDSRHYGWIPASDVVTLNLIIVQGR